MKKVPLCATSHSSETLSQRFLPVPGDGLLAAAPVEADVRRREGGARAWGAGLVTVRGGAVALVRGHAVAAVAVEA